MKNTQRDLILETNLTINDIKTEKQKNLEDKAHNQHNSYANITSVQAIKKAIILTIPHTAASFVVMGGNFAGVAFISKLGSQALAASNVAFSIQNWFTSTIGASISTATDLAAKELGKGNQPGVGNVLQKSWLLSLAFSAPSIGIMLTSKPILTLLHQDKAVIELVKSYFEGFIWGLPAMFLLTSNRQIALATGNPGTALIFVTAYQVADTALSYGLIYGKAFLPKLGIAGLSYSNSITVWTTFLCFTGYMKFSNKFKDYKIFQLNMNKQSRSELWKITKAALWAGTKVGAELVSMLAANLMIGTLGTNQQAAQEASFQYIFVINPIMFGIADTVGKLVSKEVGENKIKNAKKYSYVGIGLGAATASIFLIFFLAMPTILLKVFNIDNATDQKQDMVKLASLLLLIDGLSQIADSVRNISLRALNSFEDRKTPTLIIIFILITLFAPLSYAMGFPLNMQAAGIMTARGISITLGAILLLMRLMIRNPIELRTPEKNQPAFIQEVTNNNENTPLLGQLEKKSSISDNNANFFKNTTEKNGLPLNKKEVFIQKTNNKNSRCIIL